MTLQLYGHPFSSCNWKAQVALDEKSVAYELKTIEPDYPDHSERLRALWPVGKWSVIEDDDTVVIEHIDLHHEGQRLIPVDSGRPYRHYFPLGAPDRD
jgi:glutathione S-transferase